MASGRRTVARRAAELSLVALASLGVLSGCQPALDVGLRNGCGQLVEVDADSVDTWSHSRWTAIDPDGWSYVVSVPEDATTLYFKVRAGGSASAQTFSVPVDSLPAPSAGSDYQVEVVLDGDLCPAG